MKAISLPLLALAVCFASGPARAEADPDADLVDLAASQRAAALSLRLSGGKGAAPGQARTGVGFFISEDGLALVNLPLLGLGEVPTVRTVKGTEIKWGTVLGLFPDKGVALIRFEHRPHAWLTLASVEPEVGETIALVPLNPSKLDSEAVPPVLGPIMVKRSGLQGDLREPRFASIWSLGAGLSSEQQRWLNNGCFAMDRDGKVVAAYRMAEREGDQILLALAPLIGLNDELKRLAALDTAIPFPLPDDRNPADLATLNADWVAMHRALQEGDPETGKRLLAALRERYPDSFAANAMAFHPLFLNPEEASDILAQMPQPDSNATPASQALGLLARANLAALARNHEETLRHAEAAVAQGPADFPGHRYELGKAYLRANRLGDAERLFREAYASWPECIDLVTALEDAAIRRGDIDEAVTLAKRARELRAIYRAP